MQGFQVSRGTLEKETGFLDGGGKLERSVSSKGFFREIRGSFYTLDKRIIF